MFTIYFLSKEAIPMLETSADFRASMSNLDSKLDSKPLVNSQDVENKRRE